jgi:pimeloyl-ACP methyl ester carboxylesterase
MSVSSRVALLLATLSASIIAARADSATLVSIPTPRGAKEAFILIKPEHPVASVVLLAGGGGVLGLKAASSDAANFLVRTREKFAAHQFIVAVVDAPSDRQRGMNAIFRMSEEHAGDIGAVVSYLKREAAVPTWLVGTSAGTFSAVTGAVFIGKNFDGLVLTSTVTRTPPDWAIAKSHPNGVADLALSEITVPVLIMSHRNDSCRATPAADAEMVKKRLTGTRKVEIAMLDGGDPPESPPCEAKAAHGYFGIEAEAVDTIADFINRNSK